MSSRIADTGLPCLCVVKGKGPSGVIVIRRGDLEADTVPTAATDKVNGLTWDVRAGKGTVKGRLVVVFTRTNDFRPPDNPETGTVTITLSNPVPPATVPVEYTEDTLP